MGITNSQVRRESDYKSDSAGYLMDIKRLFLICHPSGAIDERDACVTIMTSLRD